MQCVSIVVTYYRIATCTYRQVLQFYVYIYIYISKMMQKIEIHFNHSSGMCVKLISFPWLFFSCACARANLYVYNTPNFKHHYVNETLVNICKYYLALDLFYSNIGGLWSWMSWGYRSQSFTIDVIICSIYMYIHTYMHMYICIYIYILYTVYIYVCVCVHMHIAFVINTNYS